MKDRRKYTVCQDKRSTLSYWLDFQDIVGTTLLSSITLDPENALPTDVTVVSKGTNPTDVTDSEGINHPAGTLVGLTFSGGKSDNIYRVVIQADLINEDTLARSLWVEVQEK